MTYIDEKRKNNKLNINSGSNLGDYALNTSKTIIKVIVYFIASGLVLYGTKVAASGLIPTDTNYYPYTEEKNREKLGELVSNIFVTYTDPSLSEKISFYPENADDAKYNSSNMLLDSIREYAKNPKTSNLANYLLAIVESLLSLNYWLLDKALDLLNNFPEMLTVLAGPALIIITSIVLIIINYFYLMFLWFYKMTWFFKSSSDSQGTPGLFDGMFSIASGLMFGTSKSDPSSPSSSGPSMTSIIIGCILVAIFVYIYFILMALGWGFFPAFIPLYCLCSIFNYKSVINDKKSNAGSIIWKLFRFYKATISSVISYYFIKSTYNSLGPRFGVAAGIVVLIIALFGMGITLFKQEKIDDMTPVIETKKVKIKIGGNDTKNIANQASDLLQKSKEKMSSLAGQTMGFLNKSKEKMTNLAGQTMDSLNKSMQGPIQGQVQGQGLGQIQGQIQGQGQMYNKLMKSGQTGGGKDFINTLKKISKKIKINNYNSI